VRPKKIYGVIEVKWDEAGNPVVGPYRDETAAEKARRLHRKLPAPGTA
jgi:hypothetical protein